MRPGRFPAPDRRLPRVLWLAAAVCAGAGASLAGPAATSSTPGILDSRPPEVEILEPHGGEILQGTEEETIRFTLDEGWLDDDPPPILLVVREGEEAVWSAAIEPEPGRDYEVPWTVPDRYTPLAVLEITVTDHFGWTTLAGTKPFTILNSLTPVRPPDLPEVMELGPNHPNPFNPATTLLFALLEPGEAELAVFDLRGRELRLLSCGRREAGGHQVLWDGCDDTGRKLASGTYVARLRVVDSAGVHVLNHRMTLLK
jgi:hypothetical protein